MNDVFGLINSLCLPGSVGATVCELSALLIPWPDRELARTAPAAAFANFLILATVSWCLYRGLRSARREARGYAMSIQRFGSVPILAVAASALGLLGPVDRPHNVFLWLLAFACGLGIGAARGLFVVVQVDRERRLIRIRQAEDGLFAMRLLVMFGTLEVMAIAAQHQDSFWRPLLAGCTAGCAAFLIGRFTLVWLRARAECHMELTGAVHAEAEILIVEQGAPTWSSNTARLIPGYVAVVPPDWQKVECIGEAEDEMKSILLFSDAPTNFTRAVGRDSRGRFIATSSSEDLVSTVSARGAPISAS